VSEQPSNWERMLPPCSPVVLTFAAIDTPGAYVCARTGFLLRVTDDVATRPRPPIRLSPDEPVQVTRISDDPNIALPDARRLADRLGLKVRF
jgi:hypothetical protein